MNSLLTDICNRKKKEIEALKLKCSLKSLQKLIGNKQNRGFMTWSIGWDWNQGPGPNTYKFGKEVSSILGL